MAINKLMREPVTGSIYKLQVFDGFPVSNTPEPMRYALRNRVKLKEAFGEAFYIELIKCLSRHFQSDSANDRCQIEGVSRPVIKVAGLSHGTTLILRA